MSAVNFRDLEGASYVDMLPIVLQPLPRSFGGWIMTGLGVAAVAAITLADKRAIEHFIGK